MSKMGNTIVEIQELAYQGIPDEEIAKRTKTSVSFVRGITEDLLNGDGDYGYFDADFSDGC